MAEEINDTELPEVKSCGFLVMKSDQSFLLMKHPHYYDLPKGHMEVGETEEQTAVRELREETGIQSSDIDIDSNFRFEHIYYPIYARLGNKRVKKTLVVFLARLKSDLIQVIPTEHGSFKWFPWTSPPTPMQTHTIDPLLEKLHEYLNA